MVPREDPPVGTRGLPLLDRFLSASVGSNQLPARRVVEEKYRCESTDRMVRGGDRDGNLASEVPFKDRPGLGPKLSLSRQADKNNSGDRSFIFTGERVEIDFRYLSSRSFF